MDNSHGGDSQTGDRKMVPVIWYEGCRGSWCHAIVDHLTDHTGFEHLMEFPEEGAHRAVVIIKADQHKDMDALNSQLRNFGKVVLIVTANEEGTFDCDKIKNAYKVWLQTPAPHQVADRYLPWGWTPQCQRPRWPPQKHLDFYFAGQVTHARRRDCVTAMRKMLETRDGVLITTEGFAKGVDFQTYFGLMRSSRFALCPSGPVTVDSFRVCEALEQFCVPILDYRSPTGRYANYWHRVFDIMPGIPEVEEWMDLVPRAGEFIEQWPVASQHSQSWWVRYKHMVRAQLWEDLCSE